LRVGFSKFQLSQLQFHVSKVENYPMRFIYIEQYFQQLYVYKV